MTAPRVILVVRLSAMGDLVMASGFVQALHHAHPGARLVWLVQSGLESVVAAIPGVDSVLVWPRREWRELWRARRWAELWAAIRTFRSQLRSLRADWSIDLQGLLKSGLMGWLSGAPRRTSLGGREGSAWISHEVFARGANREEERAVVGAEYAELAQHLGLCLSSEIRPRLVIPENELRELDDALTTHGLEPGRYVVLCPFTTRPQKHWPESHWRVWIEIWCAQSPADGLVLLGGAADRETAERMLQGRSSIINLVGRTPLGLSLALLSKAKGVIGVDTGLTHAAQALGVPTVALFGSTVPYRQPLHPRVEILWKALTCSPCRRHPTCGGRFDCLRQITPLEAVDALSRVSR